MQCLQRSGLLLTPPAHVGGSIAGGGRAIGRATAASQGRTGVGLDGALLLLLVGPLGLSGLVSLLGTFLTKRG